MAKSYCTQNNGDCATCSLKNYGRDCKNNLIWGGKREGAGRKPSGRKLVRLYVTDTEELMLRMYLEKLRE